MQHGHERTQLRALRRSRWAGLPFEHARSSPRGHPTTRSFGDLRHGRRGTMERGGETAIGGRATKVPALMPTPVSMSTI